MNRPNILLITTDQQRFDTIAALGNSHIFTPHLNWLTDEGTSFVRCYADCPICMPSRATIMTGKRGYTTGCVGNNGDLLPMRTQKETLPYLLTQNGYQTRGVGKMHFEPARANYGFEHIDLDLNYYREMAQHPEWGIPKDHGTGENEVEPVISTVHESYSLTQWTVKHSIDFLETRDPTRPFFLWTSFTKPHPPLDPCFHYWALYEDEDMPDPVLGDWSADLATMPKGYLRITYWLNNMQRFSPRQMQKIRRAYYALITQIDYSLGLLFARVRELGLLENTWIIFTSDHGDMLGDHHMGAKFVFQEGASHVPLIIRPPMAAGKIHEMSGKRCQRLVEMADLFPTILSMAGLSVPQDADGVNLLDHLQDNRTTPFFGNVENHTFCVMEGYEKYLWTAFGGAELLFDLKEDPYEQHNLACLPEYQDKMEYYRKLLIGHMKQTGVTEHIKGDTLIPVEAPKDTHDVAKWPGFHSPKVEIDTLH